MTFCANITRPGSWVLSEQPQGGVEGAGPEISLRDGGPEGRQGGRGQVRSLSLRGACSPGPASVSLLPPTEFGVTLGSQIFIKHITDSGLAARNRGLQEGDLILQVSPGFLSGARQGDPATRKVRRAGGNHRPARCCLFPRG